MPALILCLLTALSLLSATSHAAPSGSEALGVVVSVPPQKYLAERIGGERVQVTSMVQAGQEPHSYDPTPRQLAGLSGAALFLALGTPFEAQWLPRMRAVNPRMQVIHTDQGIERRQADHAHSHATTAHAHSHSHDGLEHHHAHAPAGHHPETAAPGASEALDPHVWLAPQLALRIAANIRDALTAADPAGQAHYARNHARLATELEQLDAELGHAFSARPGGSFLVFHPAWGYLAEAYGLRQLAVESEGKEPGPRGLQRLIEQARAAGIETVFVQPQYAPAAAETLARALGGRTVVIDPLAEDYIVNLRRAGHAIAQGLGSQ